MVSFRAPKEKHDESSASSRDSTPERLQEEQPDLADAIPDGGLTAWLQVVGSFFLFFNSW